jgi:hypothetical protein
VFLESFFPWFMELPPRCLIPRSKMNKKTRLFWQAGLFHYDRLKK